MISRRGTAFVLSVVAAVCASSGSALAAKPDKHKLWATVNICDTLRYPDQMGVRASMPGDGTRERMYMRFRAQFFNAAKNKWFNVKGNADSGWVLAGSARFVSREAGWTFSFSPPAAGSTFMLRGLVNYQWRATKRVHGKKRTVIVRRTKQITAAGKKTTVGADPPGYSSGTCQIH
jgi:hypothetical protein